MAGARKTSAAAKKAMADRGKFRTENTDGGTYSAKCIAAEKPFHERLRKSVAVWGDTLTACVPPQYAVRYRELVEKLEAAMLEDRYMDAAETSATLCNALELMEKKALADGHQPPAVDGHLVKWGEHVYCILVSGDLAVVRRKHPSWRVYHISDVCAVLNGRFDEMMGEVVNLFPNAKIASVRYYDDEIPF